MRKLRIFLAGVIVITGIGAFLNIDTTTRQGINFQVQVIKLPLYLKALDFMDRHYNYKQLVRRIVGNKDDKEDRAKKILAWMCENIKRQPESLPVVDDHVWNIIIRGYGLGDQFQDVFTTLCNYAKVDAFYCLVYSSVNDKKKKPVSFVKLNGGWSLFDAYYGVYFVNARGQIANVNDLINGDGKAFSILFKEIPEDYAEYFKSLESLDYESWRSSRAAIQSPLKRLIFWKKSYKK